MSTLAVFIALGGTGYAAVKIDGASIRDDSIRARKLVRNSLGGAEVAERKLGVVPSAATAARAASADALGGVTIRSGQSGNTVPAGGSDSVVVLCAKGERVVGGGGAYDEQRVKPYPYSGIDPWANLPEGFEAAGDRTIGSRPVVQESYGGARGPFLHPAYPDGLQSATSPTGLQGWSYQASNGDDTARTLHAYAVCVKAAG